MGGGYPETGWCWTLSLQSAGEGQDTRKTRGHSHQEMINLRSTFLDCEGPSPEIMTQSPNCPPSQHVKNCPHYLCNNILKYCSASGAVLVATLTSRGSAAQTRDGNSNTFPHSSPLICHHSSPHCDYTPTSRVPRCNRSPSPPLL